MRLTRTVQSSAAARRLVRAMLVAKLVEISLCDEVVAAGGLLEYLRANVSGDRVS